jgi:hypothetical protein
MWTACGFKFFMKLLRFLATILSFGALHTKPSRRRRMVSGTWLLVVPWGGECEWFLCLGGPWWGEWWVLPDTCWPPLRTRMVDLVVPWGGELRVGPNTWWFLRRVRVRGTWNLVAPRGEEWWSPMDENGEWYLTPRGPLRTRMRDLVVLWGGKWWVVTNNLWSPEEENGEW